MSAVAFLLRSAAALVAVVLAACAPPPDALAAYHGGFDPTRYDGGPAPAWRGGAPPAVVRFGITPFYSADVQQEMLAELTRYLAEEIGAPVVVKSALDYDAAIDMLANGDVDVAQLSPYAYVKAEKRIPDLIPLAAGVAQGSSTYASYIVTLRRSPIRELADLKGKRFGYVDELSTSGYLYPVLALRALGVDAAGDLVMVRVGSHDGVLQQLKSGAIDVGATSSDTLVGPHGAAYAGPVRILAKAGRIPYDCIVSRSSVDPALVERVRTAFLRLSVHSERGRRALHNYDLLNGFMPVPPGHYDEVRAKSAALETR